MEWRSKVVDSEVMVPKSQPFCTTNHLRNFVEEVHFLDVGPLGKRSLFSGTQSPLPTKPSFGSAKLLSLQQHINYYSPLADPGGTFHPFPQTGPNSFIFIMFLPKSTLVGRRHPEQGYRSMTENLRPCFNTLDFL